MSDVPPSAPQPSRGRHRARGQALAPSALAGAHVTRRVAKAAFGGALVGGLVEVLTDRSPGSAPAAQTPVATPTTSQVTTAARATVPPATATVTASATSPVATATPTASSPPASVDGGFAEHGALVAALTALPRGKNVAFGVGVLDAATGRRFVFDVGAPFEMASTVKVDILVATFLRAADAGRGLTAGEKSLASVMIRNSDNAAASTLFRAAGRAPGMAKAYQRMGMTATKASSAWGLTTTTPGDRLIVLEALARGGGALTAEAGAEILALMRSVTTSQRWGVGGVARAGETVAVKNGWLPRSNQGGRWVISTSGLLTGPSTDLRLAVCSRGHASQAAGIDFVEKVLTLARAELKV